MERLCGRQTRTTRLDQESAEAVIKTFIRLVREKLDRAGAVAKAAEACAEAGDADQAVTIMLDVEHSPFTR